MLCPSDRLDLVFFFIIVIISGCAQALERGPTGRYKNAQNRTF